MATREETEALLARSRITQVHGLKVADDGTIYAIATADETGADGSVNNAFITLMLLAAAHTLYGRSVPFGGFVITPLEGKRAKIGDKLVASARITDTKRRTPHGQVKYEITIRAVVHVNGELFATGRFKRLHRGEL